MSTAALERTASGLEFLQRIVTGEIPGVPIGDTLGFRIVAVDKGEITLTGKPGKESLNLIGSVHGGWTASILDSAMALATLASLDEKHDFTTLDIKINYLRPITLEIGEVKAEGRIINAGRRIALCEATVKDSKGRLLAHGTGTCLIIPRP